MSRLRRSPVTAWWSPPEVAGQLGPVGSPGCPPGLLPCGSRCLPGPPSGAWPRRRSGDRSLEVDDPVTVAAELLASRAPAYAESDWRVDTEGRTVEDVSARILEELAARYPELEVNER